MRETAHPYKVEEGFTVAEFETANPQGLVDALHLSPYIGGLKNNLEGLIDLLSLDQNILQKQSNFPYPQLFVLTDLVLLCYPGEIYEVNNPQRPEQFYKVFETPKVAKPWTVADFGTYLVLSNGACRVQKDPSTKAYTEILNDPRFPNAEVFAAFNGQCLAGGIDNNWTGIQMESVYVPDLIRPYADEINKEILTSVDNIVPVLIDSQETLPEGQVNYVLPRLPQGYNEPIPVALVYFSVATLQSIPALPADILGRSYWIDNWIIKSGIIYFTVRGTLASGNEKLYVLQYNILTTGFTWSTTGLDLGSSWSAGLNLQIYDNSTSLILRGNDDKLPAAETYAISGALSLSTSEFLPYNATYQTALLPKVRLGLTQIVFHARNYSGSTLAAGETFGFRISLGVTILHESLNVMTNPSSWANGADRDFTYTFPVGSPALYFNYTSSDLKLEFMGKQGYTDVPWGLPNGADVTYLTTKNIDSGIITPSPASNYTITIEDDSSIALSYGLYSPDNTYIGVVSKNNILTYVSNTYRIVASLAFNQNLAINAQPSLTYSRLRVQRRYLSKAEYVIGTNSVQSLSAAWPALLNVVWIGTKAYWIDPSNKYMQEFNSSTVVTTQKSIYPGFSVYGQSSGWTLTTDGNYIYAVGGGVKCYRYNPVTDVWTQIQDLPEDLDYPTLWMYAGKVWCAAGVKVDATRTVFIYRYDTAAGTWLTLTPTLSSTERDALSYETPAPVPKVDGTEIFYVDKTNKAVKSLNMLLT